MSWLAAAAAARLTVLLQALWSRLLSAPGRRGLRDDDRGDVNGYVFVTIMTAGIVMVLWVVARDRLSQVFDRAITSVTGP